MLGEVVEIRNEVPIGEHPKMHAAVVGHDGEVEAERVVDRDQGPELEQLRTARVT
jgi:hypothetical protein